MRRMRSIPLAWGLAAGLTGAGLGITGTAAISETAADDAVENEQAEGAAISINAFAFDLYRHLAAQSPGTNVFFSPFSILSALAMTEAGARGITAEEMRRVLRYPPEGRDLHEGLAALNSRLGPREATREEWEAREEIAQLKERQQEIVKLRRSTRNPDERWKLSAEDGRIVDRITELLRTIDPTEIAIANALWLEQTYSLERDYVTFVESIYGEDLLRSADFRGRPEASRLAINDWVEDLTEQRIKDLIPPGILDMYTRLVLANAIYFKGEWLHPFEERATREGDFTLADGRKLAIPLMHRYSAEDVRYGAFNADGSLFATPHELRDDDAKTPRYPAGDGFAMVEIPYRGSGIAMAVLAPITPDGLPRIEGRIDGARLAGWIAALEQRKTHVTLPRFRSEAAYDLVEALRSLGMGSAFEPPSAAAGADFSGMNRARDLYIAHALHKSFVDVNESGTEAAAATAIVMDELSVDTGPTAFIPEFRADRPFLYMIRDMRTGAILFLGRMEIPAT